MQFVGRSRSARAPLRDDDCGKGSRPERHDGVLEACLVWRRERLPDCVGLSYSLNDEERRHVRDNDGHRIHILAKHGEEQESYCKFELTPSKA